MALPFGMRMATSEAEWFLPLLALLRAVTRLLSHGRAWTSFGPGLVKKLRAWWLPTAAGWNRVGSNTDGGGASSLEPSLGTKAQPRSHEPSQDLVPPSKLTNLDHCRLPLDFHFQADFPHARSLRGSADSLRGTIRAVVLR